jgi:hypothetical protein
MKHVLSPEERVTRTLLGLETDRIGNLRAILDEANRFSRS